MSSKLHSSITVDANWVTSKAELVEKIDSTLSANDTIVTFNKGDMSFPVKGQIIFQRKVDADLLRRQVLGKSGADIKALVFSLPGLDNAQVSFWPIYVKKAPSRIEKIKIVIE